MGISWFRRFAVQVAESVWRLVGFALVVATIALLLAGCRSSVSPVGGGAAPANPISVASAHYFPTDDGKDDETYEVVLRNAGTAPVELTAAILDGRELKSANPSSAAALKSFSFDVGGRSAAQRRVRNPSDPDVRWWQFYPSPTIQPGGFASFMVNFIGSTRSHSLELRTADGSVLCHKIPRRVPGGRAVTYLAFTGDGSTALVRHSKGAPPCGVSVNGKAVAGARALSPSNAGLPGGVVVPLERPVAKGDPVFVELSFTDGSHASAFIRAMPGVYSVAPFGNHDDELLPKDVRNRFGFDDTLAVHRLPHDVACDDTRTKEHGASAAACLVSRKMHFAAHPGELSGVDFCTGLYKGEWNIYAPMADAVFSKPYRLHWGATPARFMEEEDAMVDEAVRRAAPRPVAWVPDRFRRAAELDGREFEQLAWCALMRGARIVRCHHWKNDLVRPFDGNPGLEEAWMRFNADFRRMRPRLERLIPARGWTERNARVAVLEGWCADEGVLLLVRNLDYDNGLTVLSKPRAHPFASARREVVTFGYAPPKWLKPGAAVDALDGSPVGAISGRGRISLRLDGLGDFRLVWIPAADGGKSILSTKEEVP